MIRRLASQRSKRAVASRRKPASTRRGSKGARREKTGTVAETQSAGFPVVGIGASAGGLEAFKSLLEHLPSDTGMAFVLIQHLDPKRGSLLKEILGRSTQMPIREIDGGMRIHPDHIFVGPANAEVRLDDGAFRIDPRPKERGREMAIDHFLLSLADQYKTRAIGIILSGTLSDGALGLRAIKAEGGLTFAQEEESAKFHDMPHAAIATGAVDFVFPPERIAQELARMGQHPYLRPARAADEPEPEVAEADQHKILSILRAATAVDFTNYRQTTVRRRVARRMALKKAESVQQYVEILRNDPQEVRALYDDILITVTAFFRDADVFDSLKSLVFPAIFKHRPSALPVRIWVPGCSTGEEVYSIAITLFESLQAADTQYGVQIFATDVSETAIEKARAGIYLENAIAAVSPDRVKKFFNRFDGRWQVAKSLREVCVFARQNITLDPPFSNLDLISCRNLLIYLEPPLQKRVMPLFHFALRPNGYLLLGGAESISGFSDLFHPVDRNHRVFARRPGTARIALEFGHLPAAAASARPRMRVDERRREGTFLDLQKEADRVVIGRYAPAGVLINATYDVVQFRGKTSPYLEAAPGAASFNVLKMAREGLMVELRAALLKARRTHKPVRAEGLQVRRDGGFRSVDLEVVPLRDSSSSIHHYLVLFEEKDRHKAKPASPRREAPARGSDHGAIVKLEAELTATKDYLQSIIEEQEASNEELKSANEEILSSNEELQSTNEELETAKEELQSTNEELTTVNEELQNRNAELAESSDDFANLLAGTGIAIVMLDTEGRLRRFTPQAEKLLNLLPSDRGRPIQQIKPNLKISDLDRILAEVLETIAPREREVQDEMGRWYLMRARPYRTAANRIEGTVVAFVDIDPIKRDLDDVRAYAESLVDTIGQALIVLDGSLKIRTANRGFYRTFDTSQLETEGKSFLSLFGFDCAVPDLRRMLEDAASGRGGFHALEVRVPLGTSHARTFIVAARAVRTTGQPEPFFLLTLDETTEKTNAEVALKASEAQYRLIFETAQEGIWIMNAETGVLLDVNSFVVDLLGYSRSELIGKTPWMLFADDPAAKSRFEANLAGGFGFEQEVAMRTKTGQLVYVEALTNTYRLDDRLVTQANLRDVTERAKLQDQVRQMQKLDSIGRLAGGVAHDFNNLLNIISAHVAVLRRQGIGADKRADSAQSIEKAVERGSAVVKQLLTFAKKTEVTFEPTDTNTVVNEVVLMLRETFPKQIKISTKLADHVPPIHADPNQIHQALLNLAVNARDAMPKGGVLTLGTDVVTGETLRAKFPEASGARYVELCVADTGDGMDGDTRRRIFEPFFSTKGMKGQGLGLAVVYGIVNAHRGWIDLETEKGKGTTFRLYIEVPEGREAPVAADQPRPLRRKDVRQVTASGKGPGERRTLLVVEDEEMLLKPIRDMLEENGFEVLTAIDGKDAVACHAQHAGRIDLVLLDLGLPRLGGWQAYLEMRKTNPDLRCIVASGNLDAEQRAAMQREGIDTTVRKPYTGSQILQAVLTALG